MEENRMNRLPIADPYANVMGVGMSLLASAKMKDSKLTDEERKANREHYEAMRKERQRKASVIANICPVCDAKLIRGKKNKKNDYKRDWQCSVCTSVHSI